MVVHIRGRLRLSAHGFVLIKCDFFNFSHSFFDDQLNLMSENRFDPLSMEKNDRLSSNSSKETKIDSSVAHSEMFPEKCLSNVFR